jgi:hypothetical protein
MGRGGGMEGAGKDWLGDAHDEFTPSNDQTRTTKAQNARFPLAAFPSRDAPSADPAAKLGHAPDGNDFLAKQAQGDATFPVNWLGGLSGVLGGGGGGRSAAEGGSPGRIGGDIHHEDTCEDAGKADVDEFMERFLRESRDAKGLATSAFAVGEEGQHVRAEPHATAARSAAADTSAVCDSVQGVDTKERQQLKSEMAVMEATLRFLELDLVTLIERSRDGMQTRLRARSRPCPEHPPPALRIACCLTRSRLCLPISRL